MLIFIEINFELNIYAYDLSQVWWLYGVYLVYCSVLGTQYAVQSKYSVVKWTFPTLCTVRCIQPLPSSPSLLALSINQK